MWHTNVDAATNLAKGIQERSKSSLHDAPSPTELLSGSIITQEKLYIGVLQPKDALFTDYQLLVTKMAFVFGTVKVILC